MSGREIGDVHVGASVPESLPDTVEHFEFADAVESEETVDQHDGVLRVCIPLHTRASIP
ncbi:hypothetical protein D3C73_1559860 [compost metagenome]